MRDGPRAVPLVFSDPGQSPCQPLVRTSPPSIFLIQTFDDAGRLRPSVAPDRKPDAKVAELVDAQDLGSCGRWPWGFESPLSHSRFCCKDAG